MSNLWNHAATQPGTSPFVAPSAAPAPGGGAAARFQSILQAAGKHGQASSQPGLSPAAARANAAGGAANAANGTSSSTSDADATISANDFLTLLVTEMQNQDPTADVDPNAYIDQLVQINSLEQLISINQNLAAVLDAAAATPSTPQTSSSVGGVTGIPQSLGSGARTSAVGAQSFRGSPTAAIAAARAENRPATAQGNLSAPGAAPAARTLSRALDGRPGRAAHGIRDIPTRALP